MSRSGWNCFCCLGCPSLMARMRKSSRSTTIYIARPSARRMHRARFSQGTSKTDVRNYFAARGGLLIGQPPFLTTVCNLSGPTSNSIYMYTQGLSGVMLFGLLTLAACVSIRVEPLTGEVYPPNGNPTHVQWLELEPDSPHVKLARIIATSQS